MLELQDVADARHDAQVALLAENQNEGADDGRDVRDGRVSHQNVHDAIVGPDVQDELRHDFPYGHLRHVRLGGVVEAQLDNLADARRQLGLVRDGRRGSYGSHSGHFCLLSGARHAYSVNVQQNMSPVTATGL